MDSPLRGVAMHVGQLGVVPHWTERLYPPTGGQDHLGLGSVITDRILPALSPYVVVLTIHPRYWSFYTWLLWEFWQTDRPRSKKAYGGFLRPRECIFAIGAAGDLCPNPEHATLSGAVVGTEKAAPYAREHDTYESQLNYIKNSTGGYGLYYASTIATTGLILQSQPGSGLPWDVPTPAGRNVAEAFRDAVKDTTYYREYFHNDEVTVPADVVREYMDAACLCQLRVEHAPDQPLLRDVLLHGGTEAEAKAQRATFQFLLDLADQTDGHTIDEDHYRQLIYFRDSQHGASYRPLGSTAATARRWRMYQAREYYNFALNRIWRWVVAHGLHLSHGGIRSVAFDAIVATALEHLRTDTAAASLNVSDPDLSAAAPVSRWIDWTRDAGRVAPGDLDGPYDIAAPIHEHSLFQYADGLDADHPGCLPACFAILGLLVARFGSTEAEMRYRDDWELMRAGGIQRLAMSRFFNHWRQRQRDEQTAATVFAWLFDDYVVRQHLRVATSKLPYSDTFRFLREDDRLRFNDLAIPVRMNNSRFNALSTVLHELGFVGYLGSENHPLSRSGQDLLDAGDLPERPVTTLSMASPAQVAEPDA